MAAQDTHARTTHAHAAPAAQEYARVSSVDHVALGVITVLCACAVVCAIQRNANLYNKAQNRVRPTAYRSASAVRLRVAKLMHPMHVHACMMVDAPAP